MKVRGEQVALTAKAKHADEQASGRRSGASSADFIRKAGKSVDSGSTQSQTATTSAGGSKKEQQVRSAGSGSRVRVRGEGLGRAQPQTSAKHVPGFRIGGNRRTSPAVALLLSSLQKQQRKKMVKSMGASPEAGTEAGIQGGEEAMMPLESKAADSPDKRRSRKQRKAVFGRRRRPLKNIQHLSGPRSPRSRPKHVFYTYVSVGEQAESTAEGSEPTLPPPLARLQGPDVAPAVGSAEPGSFSENIQQSSNNSSTPVTSARSSRVIKTPKRFLNEEMIPFPKGPVSSWLKQREDGKPSPGSQDSNFDEVSLQSDSHSPFALSSPAAADTKLLSKAGPGSNRLEIYKNLKKLTLKLAEKKKGQPFAQGNSAHLGGDRTAPQVKKRRRSKLMMEELDSPGVVRKLAVVVNTGPAAASLEPSGNNGKNDSLLFLCL